MKEIRTVVSEGFDDVAESDFNPDIVLAYGYMCYENGKRIGSLSATCIVLAGFAIGFGITTVGKRIAYRIIDKRYES